MAEPNSKPPLPKTQENSTTPPSNFLYKAIFVSVLVALLPLFPSSQSPGFANKTILTRSWELLHLLLVGIAISYGLFSRRNSDPDLEKEIQLKTDVPQSYVSQILQVSSVFDEELESPTGLNFPDEAKNQTWNYSQYYSEKPVVMVADESTNGTNSSTKPLFLPVRSLKLDSSYEDDKETDEFVQNGKIGGKEGTVLASPIPWRSRSERMEVNSLPNSAFDTELGPSHIPSFRSSSQLSSSSTPSPKRLSPSSSLSPEIRGKMNEDWGRKKSFYNSSPPPAPPPPPQPLKNASHFSMEKRETTQSFKNELEDLSRRGKGVLHNDDLSLSGSFKSKKSSYTGRSVGSREAQSLPPLPRNQSEKMKGYVEKNTASDYGTDDNDDDSEISDVEEPSKPTNQAVEEENEVDKKADEFIAKFREQIRLQRIESIKRSSGQRAKRNSM